MKFDIYGNPITKYNNLGNYDIFADNRANMMKDFENSRYKAYKPANTDDEGTNAKNGLGAFGDYLGAGMDIANIGIAGLGAYTGWQNLGLAKDQFNFEKAATNRDIANQGKQINNAYTNASQVGLALGGGAMTPEQIAAEKAALQNRYVNTSAIG